MSAVFRPTIDRNLEYTKFQERKHNLAAALGVTFQRRDIDANRYEETGKKGNYLLTYFAEGEGSAKNKKHGFFEVIKLTLSVLADNGRVEEFISLNYENSELYTSYRDRDFWMEYSDVNVDRLKQRFTAFRGDAYASFDTLRERILAEFARQAENSVKTAGSDIVLYLTLTVPLEGIEELMYQIIMDDFKKSMDISESSRHQGPVAEGRPVERPVEIPVVQPIHVPAEQPVQVPVEQQVEQNGKPPAMVAAPEVSPAEPQEEGLKLLYEKRYEEAVEYYKKKAKESPRDPEGWFGLSACLFLTGEIKKCTLYYNRCVENKPGFDISDRLLKLAGDDFENLYNLAERLQVIELFAEAQRYIEYLEAQSLPEDLLKKLQALPKKTGNSKSEVEA